MKTSRPVAALVLALAAAGAFGALRKPATSEVQATIRGATSVTARGAKALRGDEFAGVPRLERVVGSYRSYAIESRLVLATGGAKPAESAPPTLMLKGTWRETVARVEADKSAIVVAFTPAGVAPETLSRDELARPFLVELDADGRVSAVVFANGISGDARQALRSVVAQLQLSLAVSPKARAWHADEEDTTGQYTAEYRASSPTEVERRKREYVRVLSDRGLAPPAAGERYDVDSVTLYRLDERGAPVHITLRESLRVVTGQNTTTIGALVVSNLELVEAGRGAVPEIEVGLSERLSTLTANPGAEAAHDTQMARGADFRTLVARLADIERLSPEELRRAATHAIPQTRAVLRIYPEAAADAARMIADKKTPPTTAAILSAGLASAETDEARAALLDLARSSDVDVRRAGVQAMVQLRNGDEETIGTLKSLLSDEDPQVASAASLALGSNLHKTGGAEAGEANASAIKELIARYDAAPDDASRMTLVLAMGNAGGREVLPSLLDALGRSAPLAAAAVFALRFVPGDDVDQALDTILRKGPLASRIAATNAVIVRDRSAWTPRLVALLEGDLPAELRDAIQSSI